MEQPTAAPADPLAALARERDEWRQRAFEAGRRVLVLEAARQHLADELATVRQRERAAAQEDVRQPLAQAQADAAAVRAERDDATRERDAARRAQHDAEALLARVTGSTAWRITAPLRHALIILLGRERGV